MLGQPVAPVAELLGPLRQVQRMAKRLAGIAAFGNRGQVEDGKRNHGPIPCGWKPTIWGRAARLPETVIRGAAAARPQFMPLAVDRMGEPTISTRWMRNTLNVGKHVAARFPAPRGKSQPHPSGSGSSACTRAHHAAGRRPRLRARTVTGTD